MSTETAGSFPWSRCPARQPRPERSWYGSISPESTRWTGSSDREFSRHSCPLRFPSTPGREFSGVVEEIGQGVTGFSKGQKVFGATDGSYAEYVAVPTKDVAPIPNGVTFEQAASVPLGALTAWSVIAEANLKPGQTVVVVGAAGGVGLFAVQFAKAKGAKVFGAASRGNLDFVRSLGAEPVDYTAGPVSAKIKDADVVVDTVGGDALNAAYGLVKKGGLLLTVAGMPSEDKAKELGITAKSSGNKGSEPLPKIAEMLAAASSSPLPARSSRWPRQAQRRT